jgi:hypothetical protein
MTTRHVFVGLAIGIASLDIHWQRQDGAPANVGTADGAASARQATAVLRLDANGISEPMRFHVPPETRGMTVIVEGEIQKLYGLAALRTADGVARVSLDVSTSHAARMEESYYKEKIGTMPGSFYQNVRLGTFTAIYPYAPGQPLDAGVSSLRVMSNARKGKVKVTVLMPREDGSRVLHINVIEVSDFPLDEESPRFLSEARTIFAQAGIHLIVDEIRFMSHTRFSTISEFTEPQESPRSQSAQLAMAGRKLVSSDAMNVFVVDWAPNGIMGFSLGTPGPPISGSYYYGIVLRRVAGALMARVFAHELSHFLGLQHLRDVGASGAEYTDPLPDTELGMGNLMETTGTIITPAQAFVLSRSALLRQQ